ncbi:MAG: CsbD family protein [Rhodoplanes sp.]|uniref:CsbD family protein n=1 Tax=Rhodoplanes sp. TaxID=1968906 RepID=UPI001810594C|nr:CsbD family protein [Rhodoplanes sp.]NVO16941.1 CsbD family protein [Rhodoplanes sp.]
MNWDEVEGHWEQVKGKVRSQWGKLTEDDVEVVKGKREELLGILQARYGHARAEAEREVDSWAEQVKSLWAKNVKSG